MATEYTYQCTTCSKTFNNQSIIYLCEVCEKQNKVGHAMKGVLKILYPYDKILEKLTQDKDYLEKTDYIDLMPISSIESMPPLRIGNTPLYTAKQELDGEESFSVHFKVDSSNPTFSFKDRASALVSAFAKEHDIKTIIAASTGNAGSSLAGICASQGQKSILFVPENAPKAKLIQVLMYGAQLFPVIGNYDTAYDLSIRMTKEFGYYNRNTAYNPLTIEGKKTVSFELYKQLEHMPNKIFVSVGDGVILAGVYKGLEELFKLGLITEIPIVVAVQAEGSSNLIDNMNQDSPLFPASKTIADSIAVDVPRNFYMAKDYLQKYHGEWVKVTDSEIIQSSKQLASQYGLFVEPAAAAAYAGMCKQKINKQVQHNQEVVVLLTGSGLKDINSISSELVFPKALDPISFNSSHF